MPVLTRAKILEQLAADIDRLTNGWTETIRTPITKRATPRKGQRHPKFKTTRIKHPNLITQLEEALTAATAPSDESGGRKVPDSKPPVPSEPFAILMSIHKFIHDAPAPLGQLVGWAATAPNLVMRGTALELRALVHRANIALGYEPAPRRLEAPCPVCNRKNAILVNLTSAEVTDAFCTNCDTHWDKPELGMLARMI